MQEDQREKLKEKIARLINHGLDDTEISILLVKEYDLMTCTPDLIAIIRDLMSKKHVCTCSGGGGGGGGGNGTHK
jgi:hypothetical protein